MKSVDLSRFNNRWYKPGNIFKRSSWYLISILFFRSALPYPSKFKVSLLKLFGARVNKEIVIKPCAVIKYPWFLEVGHNVWIGEGVWIDNLTFVRIGNNVCISQGAYLLTGNHDYKKESFDLRADPIVIENGVWVGAKAIVCPGVTLRNHSVLSAGTVASEDTEPYTIYRGNPAQVVRQRTIE